MILDNEDILINEIKEVANKPFYVLNEYLKNINIHDENGFLSKDKNIIKSILDTIELPNFEKYRCEWDIRRFSIHLNVFKKEDNLFISFISELIHISSLSRGGSSFSTGLHLRLVSDGNRKVTRHFMGGDYRKLLYFIHNLESLYNFNTKSYETISVLDIW